MEFLYIGPSPQRGIILCNSLCLIFLTLLRCKTKMFVNFQTFNRELKLKGFNAFQIESDGAATRIYSRKDFYKICLTTGKSNIHYADRSFAGGRHHFIFWQSTHPLFLGDTFHHLRRVHLSFFRRFLKASDRPESLQQSPFFKIGGTPILKIDSTAIVLKYPLPEDDRRTKK